MAIAVLPFEDLSKTSKGEVLASGIAESVLRQLASLAELDRMRTEGLVPDKQRRLARH